MLLAANGLFELAWKTDMIIICAAILIPNSIAFFALCFRSRTAAISAAIVFALLSMLLQPWYCFAPFSPSDYEDPDVAAAAPSIRNVGVFWALTFAFVLCTLVIAFIARRLAAPEAAQGLK